MTRCAKCGGKTEISVESRPYIEAGLPQVMLANVEVRSCKDCGTKGLVLPNIAGLHRTIAKALVRKPARLAPEEVRFLRKYLGFSSAAFAETMGTDDETILAWEQASGKMPMRSELALRLLVTVREPMTAYPVDKMSKVTPKKAPPLKMRLRTNDGSWKGQQLSAN